MHRESERILASLAKGLQSPPVIHGARGGSVASPKVPLFSLQNAGTGIVFVHGCASVACQMFGNTSL